MIIDKDIVNKYIKEANYDHLLAKLAETESVICLHPNLPEKFLNFIDINLDKGHHGIKFISNDGWIAKKFPPNWNGKFVKVPINMTVTKTEIHPRAHEFYKNLNFKPEGWNLNYRHIWLFDTALTEGHYVEAVSLSYSDNNSTDTIIAGNVGEEEVSNTFDVFFISYDEPNADINFQRLLTKSPNAKRISNIKGIYNAHKEAAFQSTTEFFYVVDADAYIVDNFNFEQIISISAIPRIQIWHSHNVVNHLEYGYGGVKLFPKSIFNQDSHISLDVATSIAPLKVIKTVSCETRFNSSEFNSWKGAFREVVKLASGKIKNQVSIETAKRLEVWISNVDQSADFSSYVAEGATAGLEFAKENYKEISKLELINDIDWLRNNFNEHYKYNPGNN